MAERKPLVLVAGELQELPAGDTLPIASGVALARPNLRGANAVFGSGSSSAVSLPAGSVAGDMAILFGSSGWGASTPAGWAILYEEAGSQQNIGVYVKALDAADILAGTVSCGFVGSYDHTVTVAVYDKDYPINPVVYGNRASAGTAKHTVNQAFNFEKNSVLLFGSARANSSDATVSIGTEVAAITGADAASVLSHYQPTDNYAYDVDFDYSVSGAGHAECIVTIEPALTFLKFPDMVQTEITGSHVVDETDMAGGVVRRMNDAAVQTITVNAGLINKQPATFINKGVGQYSFVAGAGVTIESADDKLKLRVKTSSGTLIPDVDTADLYYLVGDLAT